jgi:hypothetical protein
MKRQRELGKCGHKLEDTIKEHNKETFKIVSKR